MSVYFFFYSLFFSFVAVVINWTDQIKELLNAQEIMNLMDNCGPLEEIAFWKSRSTKLLNISQQLQNPGVRHIQKILQLSKSLYEQRFSRQSKDIQVQEVYMSQVWNNVIK